MKFEVRDVFRHVLAIIFLGFSWKFLSEWYLYHGRVDYVLFAVLFVAGLLIVSYRHIQLLWSKSSRTHLLILLGIVILSLPWSEWLRQNAPSSREDWSRQIFIQAMVLYAAFTAFSLFPIIPETVSRVSRQVFAYVEDLRIFLAIPPVLFFILTACISVLIYKKTLLVQDSAAHFFQAKIFMQGKLYAPVPPVSDFFSQVGDMLVMKDGKWFSMYTPGYSLLLTLAMFLHAEWLLSPFLGAMTVAIWIAYAKRWHGNRVAVMLALLCLFSPFLVVMSSTIMVHTPELFIASATLYLCRMETEGSRAWRKIAIFFLLAFAILTRLFSLTAFLGPVLAFTFWNRCRARDWAFGAIAIGGLASGAVLLALYQAQTTGNPWLSGYFLEYIDLKLGFGSNFGGRIHTPLRGLENVSNNFLGINAWLNGWYVGSLFFIGAFIISRKKFQNWDRVLLLSALTVVGFYFLHVIQGLIFGPRSYYVLAPLLLLLVARSAEREKETAEWFNESRMFALIAILLITFIPTRFPDFITRYYPGRLEAGDLKTELEKMGSTRTLVFLEEIGPQYVDWNDPLLRNPSILVKNLRKRNDEAIAAFPDHVPMYFRLNVTFGKGAFESGYRLNPKPDERPPGYISFFQLALAVETQNYPDKDFYDVCYEGFFNAKNANEQLSYLETESTKEIKEDKYKKNFRMAIASVGRLLLLPKAAYEEAGKDWSKKIDLDQMRQNFKQAQEHSAASGEVGKAIAAELEKVRRRIDQNSDGTLSDSELLNFLSEKIQILELT